MATVGSLERILTEIPEPGVDLPSDIFSFSSQLFLPENISTSSSVSPELLPISLVDFQRSPIAENMRNLKRIENPTLKTILYEITFKRKYICMLMFARYSNLLFFLCKFIAHVFNLAIFHSSAA